MAIGDYTNVLQQFYIAYFGRPADPIGLNSAATALNAAGAPATTQGLVNAYSTNATVRTLVDNFGSSAESQALYGAVTTPDTIANFVTQIYLNVLDRAPDTAGLLYWSGEIASGRLIPSRVALTILDAATRTADATTVANKLAVASNFTTALDTAAEIAAYSGNEAAAIARAMLSNVDGTTNVTAFQPTVNDTIVSLLNNPNGPGSFTLTTGADVAAARVFNSSTVLVNGSGFINTLDDRDVLTGLGDNASLNVTLAANNDISDSAIVQPTLNNIKTVNVGFGSADTTTLDLSDADAKLDTVNVTRITANNASVGADNLSANVTNLSVNDATRGGSVEFNYREDVLVNTESLNLGLNNVRLSSLALQEGGDGGADQGQFFETVAITVNNRGADVDNFSIQGNEPGKNQTVNLTANGRTEINQFSVSSVDTMNITANAAVIIDKSVNGVRELEDSSISSPDLDVLNITGAGAVTIDGLDGIENGTDRLVVNAGTMTGNLSLGVTLGADADDSGAKYANRADVDLQVTSGSGNDLIVVHSNLAGTITTNAGNDEVLLSNALPPAAQSLIDASNAFFDTLNPLVGLSYGAAGVLTLSELNALREAFLALIDGVIENPALADFDGPLSAAVQAASIAAFGTTNLTSDSAILTAAPGAAAAAAQVNAAFLAYLGSLEAGPASAFANMEGVSLIDTGIGNDTVTVNDLLATVTDSNEEENSGYDDVTAAAIVTGAGNDTVNANVLRSGQDWDNFVLDDANADDLYVIKGASISTGADNDTINVASLEENATIDAGTGDDTLNVVLKGSVSEGGFNSIVLAGDTDADVTKVGVGGTREVTTAGVADRLGAVVDMGQGVDVANFIEASGNYSGGEDFETAGATLIVGRDAELRSAETVNVVALDYVAVTTTTSVTDTNANVLGTATLNLTVANQIDRQTDLDVASAVQNDDSEDDGEIYADVLRFDSALKTINLVSQERTLLQNAQTEIYEAGTETYFQLDNIRQDIALTLKANEATGVSGGKLKDDTLYTVNANTGVTTVNDGASDVQLTLNYANARNLDDAAELNITADTGAIDLDIFIGATRTDTVSNSASTTDDDSKQIENFTINFADGNSHSVDMNGFGDDDFRGTMPGKAGDVSSTAQTSFTVNSAAGAGKTITVSDLTADVITFNNVDGTQETAANVIVQVGTDNNYDILTGSGNDIFDMRNDDVRSDDGATPVNRADILNGSTGRDTLYVNGGDDLGQSAFVDTDFGPGFNFQSGIVDDDVFATIRGVERILIDTNIGDGDSDITLDEQAVLANVDSIIAVGEDEHELDLLIGNNYFVPTGPDNNNGQLTTASSALVIDQSQMTDDSYLNIESKDDDTDVQVVNLDVRVSAEQSAWINFLNTGDQDAQVEVRVSTAGSGEDVNIFSSGPIDANDVAFNDDYSDGEVVINVQTGSFDKLVLVAGAYDNLNIDIAANWGRKVEGATRYTFEVDASALSDGSVGDGNDFTVQAGNEANLIIKGTQDDDNIDGGLFNDTLMGNDGVDFIFGNEGADSIDGGKGDDYLDAGANFLGVDDGAIDTIVGGEGRDTIVGGLGGDNLTGGAGVDTFLYAVTQDESNGDELTTDTITDFVSGTDVIHLVRDAGGSGPVTRTVDLSSFRVVTTGTQGENSLRGSDDGTIERNAQLDGYYSSGDGQLSIDIDGDGEISSDRDFVINSATEINQKDIQTFLVGVGNDTTVYIGNNTSTLTLDSLDMIVTDLGTNGAAIDFSGITQDVENIIIDNNNGLSTGATSFAALIEQANAELAGLSNTIPFAPPGTLATEQLVIFTFETDEFLSGDSGLRAEFANSQLFTSLNNYLVAEYGAGFALDNIDSGDLNGLSLDRFSVVFNDVNGDDTVDQAVVIVGAFDANNLFFSSTGGVTPVIL